MVAMLDRAGITLALIFGAVVYLSGGFPYLLLMLVFLFISVVVTKYGYYEKKEMGIYEHDRSWENVLSNGLIPALAALATPVAGPMPYICSIAAITADKFGSELGVLGGEPVSLAGFRRVKPGTSGAVSSLGFMVSLMGAAIIGIISIFLFDITPTAALLVALIGFAGGLVDTLFGVFEEKGLGTKGTTNLICAAVGALGGYLLVM